MASHYILRYEQEAALYCFYHTGRNEITHRIYKNSRWSQPEVLIKNAREQFTVTASADGVVYLFCQDTEGDIILSTYNGRWSSRVALKNQSDKIQTVLLNPMITDKGLCIVYNVSSAEDGSTYLVMQRLNDNGQWNPASRIDKFAEMSSDLYYMQPVSQEHVLLFYQTRTPENNIGYRELTPSRQGGFTIIHTTYYHIADTSFLTTDQCIHALYVAKSMFSSQLVYRKKEDRQFTDPVVLYEGQRIENVLLSIVRDNLYVSFVVNQQLLICYSEDKGVTFSRPTRYRNKFCASPVKAVYLTTGTQAENQMYARQVYIDANSPWDVQLIPDLYEDFYPAPPVLSAEEKREPEPPDEEQVETFEKLKNRLDTIRKQNEDKDRQLLQMTSLLKSRNEEMAAIGVEKQNQIKNLRAEVTRLQEQITALTQETRHRQEERHPSAADTD